MVLPLGASINYPSVGGCAFLPSTTGMSFYTSTGVPTMQWMLLIRTTVSEWSTLYREGEALSQGTHCPPRVFHSDHELFISLGGGKAYSWNSLSSQLSLHPHWTAGILAWGAGCLAPTHNIFIISPSPQLTWLSHSQDFFACGEMEARSFLVALDPAAQEEKPVKALPCPDPLKQSECTGRIMEAFLFSSHRSFSHPVHLDGRFRRSASLLHGAGSRTISSGRSYTHLEAHLPHL